ncbi:MAG: hypothetical protein AAFO74_05285 [Pseudomonadota bacterium]
MADSISVSNLLQDSVARTKRLIVPSLPFAVVFAVMTGILVWGAGALPEGGAGFVGFTALAFATLFAHSLFSVAMYRAALPMGAGQLGRAWKLSLAWMLIFVVASIGGAIIVLFFSLIGASLGVVSGEAGQEIVDMTAQMREAGTFWPLFALFSLTLFGVFWFAVRISTFAAATSARGQVHVFRTWYWTKGHFRTLAPLAILFIILPVIVCALMASAITQQLSSHEDSALMTGLSVAVFTYVLTPSAWLGHGFASAVYAALAPADEDQPSTPA